MGGGLGEGTVSLPMDTWSGTDEDVPFKGLPPLPKVFREPQSSSSPSLLPGAGEEVAEGPERGCSSLQDRITRLPAEMLRLRRADLALFRQLHTLALEIQDLKELQEEMESLGEEELFAEERGRAGGDVGPVAHIPYAGATAAFELTI